MRLSTKEGSFELYRREILEVRFETKFFSRTFGYSNLLGKTISEEKNKSKTRLPATTVWT